MALRSQFRQQIVRAGTGRRFPDRTALRQRALRQADLSRRQREQVRRLIVASGESNHNDVAIATDTDVVQTMTVTDMTDISQGDGTGQRVGDRIQPTSLQVKAFIDLNGSSAAAGMVETFRIMVIRWKRDTANEDFTTHSQVTENPSGWLGMYLFDPTERKKYDVLHDKSYTLAYRLDAGQPCARLLDFTIPLTKGAKVIYNEGLTTGTNKIYVCVMSSQNAANTVEWKAGLRLRYKDI